MNDVLLLSLLISFYSLLLLLAKISKQPVPSHRVSVSESVTTPGRKTGVIGSGSTHVLENSEELPISVSVTLSPDSQTDTGEG